MEIYASHSLTIPGRPQRWMRPGQAINPKTGRIMRITEKVPADHKRQVGILAQSAWRLKQPYTGPLLLTCRFIFDIPVSWPRRTREAAMAGRVMHMADPDLDQLIKQIMDSLSGIAFVDDNQIVGFHNCAKRYGGPERTEITLSAIRQLDDEVTPGQKRVVKAQSTKGR